MAVTGVANLAVKVSGTFGTRRIAFVDAPGNMRLEFMEQLQEP